MLGVTRSQILYVSVYTTNRLDNYGHVISIITDLGPGLDILHCQWGQVEREFQLSKLFVL